jgi:hypothetical protein
MVAGREVEAAATKSDTERKLTLWNAVKSYVCCIETFSLHIHIYMAIVVVLMSYASQLTLCIRRMMTSLLIKLDSVPESPLGAKVSSGSAHFLAVVSGQCGCLFFPQWQVYPWIPVLARFSSYG